MTTEGNKHGDTYNAHDIEVGQGCLDILRRLNYSNGVATDYDDIRWKNQDENYVKATIGTSSVRVHISSKKIMDITIPYCQTRGATHTVSRIIYEMLPWFISHQAIWYVGVPKEADQVAIYTTPPSDFDQIINGVSTHYFVAMNTAALFLKTETAQFIDQWGSSGMKFKIALMPSLEILTSSERAEIDKAVRRRRQ